MKQCIATDMDGVMADIYQQMVDYEQIKIGKKIDLKSIEGITESKAFTSYRECLSRDGFFVNAPVMEGAIDAVKYLNDKYRLLVVSAATEYPKCMLEKIVWLEKYFPFISYKQIVFCGIKDFVKADVLIDDHLKHLMPFEGSKILFAQPHNVNDNCEGVVRTDWRGICEIL